MKRGIKPRGRTSTKWELILLYDRLKFEPKKMHKWLKEHGHEYSYWTLKKYYGYWGVAETITGVILKGEK